MFETCAHPSIWKLLEAFQKDIQIQKKIIHDENSGQPGIQRRKYYALNQRVQAVAQNYESYSDKIKYLKYIVNLWNTIITGGQDDV